MKKFWPALVSVLLSTVLNAQFAPERYPVIPQPQTLLQLSGQFDLHNGVTIITEQKSTRKECEFFRQQVRKLCNINLEYGKISGFEPCIWISLDSFDLPAEGYEMYITKDGINLYGNRAGIFYGLQTILQLIQKGSTPGSYIIPSCSIIDYPRFSWRGMHLDVSRHFFPKENVKEYLRYMALYKLNTFHWHLTDDQGWRIEIKKYPLLTSVGAWRNATLIGHYSESPDRYDSTRYGGFYTQEEIKEVVRFADSLHITVVPEIEMPGHAGALIASYPVVTENDLYEHNVKCTWGVFTEVLSPKDTTFTILENILSEVISLFPGKYIHIGGDECPKEQWKNSAFCQNEMRKRAFSDEAELQSWFIQHFVNYLGARGKKAIGWDEILEGGLADSAAVMSWRGEDGGIAAAKAHHYVVMTPGSHCYFDHYQSQNKDEPLAIGGYLPLDKVYSYDPVPASLSAQEKKYIMGVQANVWTEYIPEFSQVQYLIFPRMAALAEVAWTRKDKKLYDEFLKRVIVHMDLYTKMGVNYSRAIYDINATYSPAADGNGILLSLNTIAPSGEIRYSYGGLVTLGDSVYSGPIRISSDRTIRASVFNGEERMGRDFVQEYQVHKAMGRKVTLKKQPSQSYNTGGTTTLVDGITGRSPWTGSEWLGWWGDTMDVVIDLGTSDTIHKVSIVTLRDSGSWIYAPSFASIRLSEDGVNYFYPMAEQNLKAADGSIHNLETNLTYRARFVRIWIPGCGIIPEGSPGAGYPAWLFVSEIIVE